MHTNIFIFGDSIAFGKYDSAGGWPQKLNYFLSEQYLSGKSDEFYVYNLSVSGDRSQEILVRFDSEMASRKSGNTSKEVVIFAIGLNDSAYVLSQKTSWTSKDEFKVGIQKLVTAAKKFSETIIFVGLYPINEEITNPMPWDMDKSYHNETVEQYDQILKTTVEENGAQHIPLFDKFIAADYKKLLHDGAHPNSAGHQLIFETIRDYLLKKKII
jgi:lysophospholipase L1-like esterase